MIEVEIRLINVSKTKAKDKYVYPLISVKGHANEGESTRMRKCCYGISACILGIRDTIVDQENYIVEKGYFRYFNPSEQYDKNRDYDTYTHQCLNVLVYQLYNIYRTYPEQFKSFQIKEIKKER